MPKTIALGVTHPGTVRNRNGNAFYLLDTLVPGAPDGTAAHALHAGHAVQFYAVASGIGGHGIGDASALAALDELQEAIRRIRHPDRFDFFEFGHDYLQQADRAVRKVLHDHTDVYAGASLTVLCLAGENAYVLSCGDCRCYRLRECELTLLTDDDDRAKAPPHRLASFLGRLGMDRPDKPRLRQFPLETEDIYLLTTPGLTSVISDEALEERLNAPEIFTAKPEHLMRQALALNARDNLSAVMLRIIDLASSETELTAEPRYPRHRTKRGARVSPHYIRTALVLLASIALGLFAGWILLTMVF